MERYSRQLEQFYGPLLAISHASNAAWGGFRTLYRAHESSYWHSRNPPTDAEAHAWRLWMKEVFMPLNERAEALVVEHADLLVESEIPRCLLELCAHVEAYRGVIAEWDEEQFSHATAPLNYPQEVLEYARTHYSDLKSKQEALIRAGA